MKIIAWMAILAMVLGVGVAGNVAYLSFVKEDPYGAIVGGMMLFALGFILFMCATSDRNE